ncbi:hypothetical protein KCP73_13215 [Salmonella enterica subsp. enterica]|nr:hypothetical protein KCP73_13215 [Salmonella enterica subsp. enterica]
MARSSATVGTALLNERLQSGKRFAYVHYACSSFACWANINNVCCWLCFSSSSAFAWRPVRESVFSSAIVSRRTVQIASRPRRRCHAGFLLR